MSRSALAKNWKKATPQEQERFVELFQKLLGNVYITAMEEYAGETVRYGKERVEGERASVETFIVRAGSGEIPVNYRLRVRSGRWLVYDVTVEGVSIISNYRGSFNSIVRKNGISGLLEQLDKKVNADN
jgi:phospholipid transport system substrate-binding protein